MRHQSSSKHQRWRILAQGRRRVLGRPSFDRPTTQFTSHLVRSCLSVCVLKEPNDGKKPRRGGSRRAEPNQFKKRPKVGSGGSCCDRFLAGDRISAGNASRGLENSWLPVSPLFGSDRTRRRGATDIQTYSGIAPVVERSGKSLWVHNDRE
jgi:hypothetical protein